MLTINNKTRVVDIIVKVDVSQMNLKEFWYSVINEAILNNQQLTPHASMLVILGQYGIA